MTGRVVLHLAVIIIAVALLPLALEVAAALAATAVRGLLAISAVLLGFAASAFVLKHPQAALSTVAWIGGAVFSFVAVVRIAERIEASRPGLLGRVGWGACALVAAGFLILFAVETNRSSSSGRQDAAGAAIVFVVFGVWCAYSAFRAALPRSPALSKNQARTHDQTALLKTGVEDMS